MAFMGESDFKKVVRDQCSYITGTLDAKAGEYAQNGDRLHNFNQIAHMMSEPVDHVIWMFACKHLSCVVDMIKDPDKPRKDLVEEKIGDLINYLVILKAHYLNEWRDEDKLPLHVAEF